MLMSEPGRTIAALSAVASLLGIWTDKVSVPEAPILGSMSVSVFKCTTKLAPKIFSK